jgi:hypothetical protein
MYTLFHTVQTGYGVKSASYPMVAEELPKWIKRPRREADNLLRPIAEVKMLQLHEYSPPQRPDLLWRQNSFLSNGCRGTSQGIKRRRPEADNLLRPRAEVKMLQLDVYPPPQLPDRLWRPQNFPSNGCRGTSLAGKAAKARGCQFTTT